MRCDRRDCDNYNTNFVIALDVLHLEVSNTRELDNLISPPSECMESHVQKDIVRPNKTGFE